MLLFRLAWVTSWLSLLLTSSQSLLRSSDYRLATESEKDFIPLDSLGEMPELLAPTFPLTTQLNSLDSVTFQPSLTLSGPQPVRQRTGRSPHSKGQWVAWQNSLENRSCPSTVKSQEVVPEILSTFSVDVPQEHSADLSLPQRIGKIIKGLFDWSGLLSPKAATEPSGHLVTVTASVDRRVLQAKFIKQGVSGENRSSKQKGKVENLADEMPFQVWVNGKAIAQLSQQHQAEAIAQSFKNALSKPDFEPLNLKPALLNEKPAILMGDRLLLVVEQSLVAEQTANRELLAINWTNNLRSALGVVPLDLAQAQEKMYGLVETRSQFEGLASWYGGYFHGRMTANGEIFNQHAFTAAHPSLPFNTYLKVTNLKTDESAIVRINDRGPYIAPRTLDLSRGVAQCIKSEQAGVVPYSATIMKQSIPVDNI